MKERLSLKCSDALISCEINSMLVSSKGLESLFSKRLALFRGFSYESGAKVAGRLSRLREDVTPHLELKFAVLEE